ncbi:MAG: heme-binding protein [Roseiarcus sp.]
MADGPDDLALSKGAHLGPVRTETQAIREISKPDAQAHGLEHTNGGLVTFAGGIPLKAPDGELLGAIGVSGGEVAQDFAIARAGAASLKV